MFEQVRAAGRQARLLEHVEHRPWPPPAARWALGQTLEDVFFAHWRVPAESVRTLLPDEVELDLHDGAAWVGIVALRVTALRGRGLLPVPGLSSFLQLNVRTYVRGRDDRPGSLVLQPRRVEPVRRRGRTPPLRPAVLPRAAVARPRRRLARRRVRADRRARPRLQRALPRGRRRRSRSLPRARWRSSSSSATACTRPTGAACSTAARSTTRPGRSCRPRRRSS